MQISRIVDETSRQVVFLKIWQVQRLEKVAGLMRPVFLDTNVLVYIFDDLRIQNPFGETAK